MDTEKINFILPGVPFKVPNRYFEKFDARLYRRIGKTSPTMLNQVKNQFIVPINYFETLFEKIEIKIKNSKNNSNNIHSKFGFITPPNYFNTLEEKFYLKLEREKLNEILGPPINSFKLPEGYFKGMDHKVLNNAPEIKNETKFRKTIGKRFIYSIAAIFVLSFFTFLFVLNQNNVLPADPLAELSESELLEYAYENVDAFDPQSLDEILSESEFDVLPLNEEVDEEVAGDVLEFLQ